MNSVVSPPTMNHASTSQAKPGTPITRTLGKQPLSSPNTVVPQFTSEENLWVFENGHILSGNLEHPGINYQRTAEAHCFFINPDYFNGPLVFLHIFNTAMDSTELFKNIVSFSASENTSFTFIECFVHENAEITVDTSVHTEIVLQTSARVQHLQILKGQKNSNPSSTNNANNSNNSNKTQILNNNIIQQSKSHYHGAVFAFDLSYHITNDLHLSGEHAKATLQSLLSVKEKQKAKLFFTAHHHHPHCESSMLVRGLADNAAVGEFTGKIIVDKDAIHSQARLENKNLLLCEQAEIITRPLLEVYNDNIQCSHGATVGELDTEALFYLKSRGIPEHMAKKMLIDAFIHPILEGLTPAILPYLEECFREY